jgi:protein SCO1/2
VTARARLSLLTTAVVVLGVLVALALMRPVDTGTQAAADGIQTGGSPFLGATRPSAPSPAFALRDQRGRPASVKDAAGKPAIVTFMYSTCQDTCPAMARQIATALDTLGQDVPTLLISVDPKGDTPASAQRFLNKMGLRGRARFVLGSRAELAPVWKAYGIQPQGAGFDHSAYVLILDGQGRQRVSWPSEKLTSDGLAHDVRVVEQQDAAQAAASR